MKRFQNGGHGQEPLDAAHTGLVSNDAISDKGGVLGSSLEVGD